MLRKFPPLSRIKIDKMLVIRVLLLLAAFYVDTAFAAAAAKTSTYTIATISKNVTDTFGDVAKLITAGAYIAGMGFGLASILKFKAHKDNPNQIPVGTPIALLFIAAALLFLPSVFSVSGGTLFGGSGSVAGVTGVTSF